MQDLAYQIEPTLYIDLISDTELFVIIQLCSRGGATLWNTLVLILAKILTIYILYPFE